MKGISFVKSLEKKKSCGKNEKGTARENISTLDDLSGDT